VSSFFFYEDFTLRVIAMTQQDMAEKKKLRILHLEDEPHDTELIRETLTAAGIDCEIVHRVESRDEFLRALAGDSIDLILGDYRLPAFDGLTALAMARQRKPDLPFIIVSGTLGEEAAIDSLKAGATDYVLKDRLSRLAPAVGRAIRETEERAKLRRAEDELHRSEERYRALYEDNPSMFFTVDAKGTVISVNPFGASQLGYTTDELVGQSVLSVFHSDDQAAVLQQLKECLQHPFQMFRWQFRKVRKDGAIIWVEEFARAVSKTGKPASVLIVCADITERKKSDERVQEHLVQTKLLQQTIENLNRAQAFEEIYTAAGEGILKALNAERYAILRFENDQKVHFKSWRNLSNAYRQKVDGHCPWRIDELNAQLLSYADVSKSNLSQELKETILGEGIHALLFVPLIGPARLLGKFMVYYDQPHTFSYEELQLAQVIAQNLTTVLLRQEALEETQLAEKKYRTIFENTTEGVYQSTPQGKLIIVNPAMVKLFGYRNAEEMLAIENTVALYWDALERQRLVDLGISTGTLTNVEVKMKRADGEAIWVLMNDRPVKDAEGKIIYFEGSLLDITERKRAEEALQDARSFLQQVVDTSPTMIFVVDGQGRVVFVNQYTAQYYGSTPEELISKSKQDVHRQPSEAKQFVSDDQEVIRTRRKIVKEELNTAPNGEQHWFHTVKVPLVRPNGTVEVLGISTDITERKRLEEQLRQSQKMEAIGRLAGGVAHDFNNLLTGITCYADLLLSSVTGSNPLRSDVEEIKKASDRATSLTRQLLAFGRKQMLTYRVVNLNTVVAGMQKMLSRLISEDIELTTRLEPDLRQVKADLGQLEQVIVNLAINARDAMPTGGRLSIETANVELNNAFKATHPEVQPGPYVLLAVSDTGSGMDETVKANIFEPFFTTKELGKGSGLGLATVYGIIKQCGGHIIVNSEPGQGSTFNIYLPRMVEEAPAVVAHPEALRPVSGQEVILLVEDDEGVRKLTRRILSQSGYSVLEAGSGAEALQQCEQYRGPIHLLLIDVVMPQMSGRMLAERLSQLRPALKVLYMSGYTDDSILRHGVMDEGVAFLQKPFTSAILTHKVREVLDQ
jgi:PAS domain S-box-containing protein